MESHGIKGRIAGSVLLLWSYMTLLCASFLLVPLLPIFVISPVAFRHIYDRFLVGPWHCAIGGWLEVILGMRIVTTGDSMPSGDRSLIIMNHRTHLDWMYFWPVLVREECGVSTEKIILKSEIKKLPGAGWSQQAGAYLFINRKWEQDKIILSKFIKYFSDIDYKTQILLFPEGTDMREGSRQKSDSFARKNNLPCYEYVLHPRTTGFTFMADKMRQNNHLDAIYDVTLGFPDHIPQHQLDLPTGNYPKEVHFHIKRYEAVNLPSTEEGLNNWCQAIWAKKEERLKSFYKDLKFVESTTEDNVINIQREAAQKVKYARHTRATFLFKVAISYFTLILVVVGCLIYNYTLVKYCMVVQLLFFIIMSHKLEGFEMFQIDYFNRFFNKKTSIMSRKQR